MWAEGSEVAGLYEFEGWDEEIAEWGIEIKEY
jgi:hypothetical protein